MHAEEDNFLNTHFISSEWSLDSLGCSIFRPVPVEMPLMAPSVFLFTNECIKGERVLRLPGLTVRVHGDRSR